MADQAKINVGITGDVTGLNNALDQAGKKVDSFSSGQLKQLGGAIAGAFAISAVTNFVKESFAAADALVKLSERTKVSTDNLQAFQVLADRGGIEFESIVEAWNRIRKVTAEATAGEEKSIKILKDLGISMSDISTMDPGTIFYKALQNQNKSAEAGVAIFGLLGKKAAIFDGIANQIAKADISQLTNQFKDMGLILDEIMLQKMEKINHQIEEMMKKTGNQIKTKGYEAAKGWEALMYVLSRIGNVKAQIGEGGISWNQAIKEYAALEKEANKKQDKKDTDKADIELSAKITLKEDSMFWKKWNTLVSRMKGEAQVLEMGNIVKARGYAVDDETDPMKKLEAKEKLIDAENQLWDAKKKLNEEILKAVENDEKLNRQEDELASKWNKEYKDYQKETKNIGKDVKDTARFSDIAKISGESKNAPNVAVSNAIRQLTIAEKTKDLTEKLLISQGEMKQVLIELRDGKTSATVLAD